MPHRIATRPSIPPVMQAVMALMALSTWPALAHAQSQATTDDTGLATRIVAPRAQEPRASISGFGNTPAWQQPIQAQRYNSDALKQAQVQRLADLSTLDASVSDSYNAGGYWDFMAVRGFQLDNTQNYLREGLPISAETSLPLDNKAAVEVLKGTSGMQSGISSPGGLINLLVKRPEGRLRHAELGWSSRNTQYVAVDLSERLGTDQAVGVRLNAAHEQLRPTIHPMDGQRHLVSLAADWRLSPDTLVEIEVEHSRRQQSSAPGYSLWGNKVPSASQQNPNINLNGQAWTHPVVMEASTGTISVKQSLGKDWKLVGVYGEQHLRSDDRAAFPFGCSAENDYSRYCSDGTYDIYDYRSDDELRITRALDVNVSGSWKTGTLRHDTTVGLASSTQRIDVPTATYDYKGVADVNGQLLGAFTFESPSAQNVRRQRSQALYLRDAIQLAPQWTTWVGTRITSLDRRQSLSDGSVATAVLKQTMTTPWVALGYELAPQQQVYLSWGEGVENLIAPFAGPGSAGDYVNPGAYLPAVKSRQTELGVKSQSGPLFWSVNWFRVARPQGGFVDTSDGKVRYQLDGDALHQGLEGQVNTTIDRWTLSASAAVIDAKRRGSADATINGKAPVNVPDHTIKLSALWQLPATQGLTLGGHLVHEGARTADAQQGIRISSWTRLDASIAGVQRLGAETAITWTLAIKNLADHRAWRESPTQFKHTFLIPMASRTASLSAQLDF